MGLSEQLRTEVNKLVRSGWETRDGRVVPEPADLKLGNDGIHLDATVLYADMNGSTRLVDSRKPEFAAEVYKSYLTCAARVIKDHGGMVTAYDGDRIMALFIGDLKNTTAAECALKINWAIKNIVNPEIEGMYGQNGYEVSHVVGIDTSSIMASRIGVRNDNDIVWVGRAANYAAKLTELNTGFPIYITGNVFRQLADSSKYGDNHEAMWEKRLWTVMDNMEIYRSNWTWSF